MVSCFPALNTEENCIVNLSGRPLSQHGLLLGGRL